MRRRNAEADAPSWPHPREAEALFGHEAAERVLLDSYRAGRLHHAWLVGGAPGIGKATLAYRMARFVLSEPDPFAPRVQAASSLAVEPAHPVFRQVAARAHGDLLVLERGFSDSGVLRTVITVDEVRRTVSFFGSTAGQGGWRVCIVDSADELQAPQAANALLKVLEEPPQRSLFLLVSDAPGRLLPTIRSRCRRLDLRPLSEGDLARAVAAVSGREETDADVVKAAAAAHGSVARALALLEGPGLAFREKVSALLATLPATNPHALHALGDALGGDEAAFDAFLDTVGDWLSARLEQQPRELARLARLAEVWETVARSARDVEIYNLERKPFVFAVFGLLAEAARP